MPSTDQFFHINLTFISTRVSLERIGKSGFEEALPNFSFRILPHAGLLIEFLFQEDGAKYLGITARS